jgi:membrane-associated phospholipid phosphatase
VHSEFGFSEELIVGRDILKMKTPRPSNDDLGSTSSSSAASVIVESYDRDETSKWSQALKMLDTMDQQISSPLFELSLPAWLEALYTVPACFFGLIPSLAVGPLWVAHLACESVLSRAILKYESMTNQQRHKVALLKHVTFSLSIIFLLAWGLFLIGYKSATTKFLGKNTYYMVSYAGSTAFLFHILLQPLPRDSDIGGPSQAYGTQTYEGDDLILSQVASLSFYYLVLWSSSVLIVLALKRWTQRVRPCANNETNARHIARKTFPSIARFLAKHQSHESFPSGDATAATSLAIPLIYISWLGDADRTGPFDVDDAPFPFLWFIPWTTPTTIACLLVILACTGRVFVLAHHVGDVVAGALVPCMFHLLYTYSPVGATVGLGDVYTVRWYHPILVNTVTTIYALSTLKKHTVNGNTSGTKKVS